MRAGDKHKLASELNCNVAVLIYTYTYTYTIVYCNAGPGANIYTYTYTNVYTNRALTNEEVINIYCNAGTGANIYATNLCIRLGRDTQETPQLRRHKRLLFYILY